jgi:glycine dehydrogenase
MNDKYKELEHPDCFLNRHIGPRIAEIQEMAKFVGAKDLDNLIEFALPSQIKTKQPIQSPEP